MSHPLARRSFRRAVRALLLSGGLAGAVGAGGAAPAPQADVLIAGGTIYDGGAGKPYVGDVALKGDRIVYVG
ncbi:MAG: amidohydrolase, partial [Sphingomonadaceae bacterium MED-G03]